MQYWYVFFALIRSPPDIGAKTLNFPFLLSCLEIISKIEHTPLAIRSQTRQLCFPSEYALDIWLTIGAKVSVYRTEGPRCSILRIRVFAGMQHAEFLQPTGDYLYSRNSAFLVARIQRYSDFRILWDRNEMLRFIRI